jgi:Tol biopolymer transport system component
VFHGLAWAPDGRSLAVGFLGGDLRPALGVFDVADRRSEPRVLARPVAQAIEQISWSPDGTRIAYAATWPG